MKRFVVFAWDNYYPEGGWFDFVHCTDDREEAVEVCLKKIDKPYGRWGHVVDIDRGEIVWNPRDGDVN